MKSVAFLFFSMFLCFGAYAQNKTVANIDASGLTIEDRVSVPDGYIRPPYPEFTFQHYLRSLPMKADGSKVVKHDGFNKFFECYAAVVDLDIDKSTNLFHGEHAVQYMRSLYLFNSAKFELIDYSFDDNRSINFLDYGNGYRWVFQDSVYTKELVQGVDFSEKSFNDFMKEVYENTTTRGLNADTRLIEFSEVTVGDVFIHPKSVRSPGHAVIIMDMVVNPVSGERFVLLGQGFNPTQDIHILNNPYETDISPWYRVEEDAHFFTTIQWTFRKKHCRRFIINANSAS
jgi:hypothetical protein